MGKGKRTREDKDSDVIRSHPSGRVEFSKPELRYEDAFEDVVEEDRVGQELDMDVDDVKEKTSLKVWRPELGMTEGEEELIYDSRAYTCYHKLRVEWPSLSFAILPDPELGAFKSKFPVTATILAGPYTSDAPHRLQILRATELHKTKYDGDESDEEAMDDDDSDIDFDSDPILDQRDTEIPSNTNRIRVDPQTSSLAACWGEDGQVRIFNLTDHIESLKRPKSLEISASPLFSFKGHQAEGFALDWSPVSHRRFASGGSTDPSIVVWEPRESTWDVSGTRFQGHSSSVEDIQWSPSEANVFASCSSDKSIRIWDARADQRKTLVAVEGAHSMDVNVISWSRLANHLLASGGDEGEFKVWDLRNFKSSEPAGRFKWHQQPITSLEWSPISEPMLVVSSADDSVTIWDMSLEEDPEAQPQGADLDGMVLPPQLLFVHRGQKDVKEVHWHPQVSGMVISTASDGFDLFKADNVR